MARAALLLGSTYDQPPMTSMSLRACAFRACNQVRYLRAQELGEADAGAALLRLGVSD
jgi:hypothetical protein